jgi:Condensation domain
MNDRATRIANLSPKQRRLLELMLQERAQAHADESRIDESIPALPRHSEGGEPAVFPLTSSQRLLWFTAQHHPDLAAPPGTLTLRLRGPLDVAALQASLCEICVRHEVLRTTFDTREDGEPVQIVGPPRPVFLTQIDLSELPSPAREAEVDRLLVQEVQRPFDLSGDLMVRAMLLRLDDEEHVLLLVMHHIVSDGWSWEVLFGELQALYRASRSGRPANLPELPVQYADYALWEQQRLQDGALQQQMEYWKKQLANAAKVLDIPTDHHQPLSTVEGMWQELRMPASLLQELYTLCRRQNVTLFVTLVSAWGALLHRYSGQDDILILTPFVNRNQAEVKKLIGMFSNTLILRHDFSGDPSFVELLGRVRQTVLDAISNGELPFETLVKELHPTPMTWFSLREAPRYSLELDGLQQVERIDKNRARVSSFLSLWMVEGDEGLRAWLNYHPDLFERSTIARMLGHLQTLLESVVADPEQRISKLPLPIKAGGGRWARFKRWLRRVGERARGRLRHTVRRARRAAAD